MLKLTVTWNQQTGQMQLDDGGTGIMNNKITLFGFLELIKETGSRAIEQQAAKNSVQAVPRGSGNQVLKSLAGSNVQEMH